MGVINDSINTMLYALDGVIDGKLTWCQENHMEIAALNTQQQSYRITWTKNTNVALT